MISVLPDLLKDSDSTTTGYYYAFMRWTKWASAHGITKDNFLPASGLHVALYLANLVQSANTPSPIISAFYGLRWAHSLAGKPSPTDSALVRNTLDAAKRRLSGPVNKKEPITPELLEKMYDALSVQGTLYSQITITTCLVAYAGFLRSDELLKVRRCDLVFDDTYMGLFLENSKTDIYRDGSWVLIARTDTRLCPVCNIQKYLFSADIHEDSSEFIFRDLTKFKIGHKLRKTDKPLLYGRLRELFIEAFSPFVDTIKSYGLHSLRSGGATAAANLGIPDRLFKRHGRWRSENAKDGYVKDMLRDRLSVSLSLGL